MKAALLSNLPLGFGKDSAEQPLDAFPPVTDRKTALGYSPAAAKSATPPPPAGSAGGVIHIRISVASRHDNQSLLGDKNVINHHKGQEEPGSGR